MYGENPVKLPPGVVEDMPPDEESSYGSDLGTTAKVTWSWLKSKFGKHREGEVGYDRAYDRDYYNGKIGKLSIEVRPFDAHGKWLEGLYQEFTADALKDAQRYGFELMRDMPEVQGFWIEAALDKYWPKRGESWKRRVMMLGRYERAHTPNARFRLGPHQRLESRYVLAGAYRGRDSDERSFLTHSVVVDTADDELGRDVRVLCRQPLDHMADPLSATVEQAALPPTCPRCLERWTRVMQDQGSATDRHEPNARKAGSFGEEKTGVERGAAGRFAAVPKCDFCGKPITGTHYSDTRVCGNSDGPGFYLCDRKRCVAARERLEEEHGLNNLALRYAEQRKQNDGHAPNASVPSWLNPQQKELFAFFQSVKSASMADALRAVPGARSADVRRMHERGVLVSAPSPGRGNMLRIADSWHTPNLSSHYVWVLDSRDVPLDEGPYGPYDLQAAKQYARISATEGAHDRAVSVGRDPDGASFKIVRRYQSRTGERVL